ncbi:MAG TPA: arginase family protein [Candidatus Limnocylindrales bacterium]
MSQIALLGVPTALGGHLSGMERTPAGLRALGLIAALQARPDLADVTILDAGDVPIDPGFRPDQDPRAKNRDAIAAFLPRERDRVVAALGDGGSDARLLVVGGDCTAHAGAMSGLRRRNRDARLAIAWFDAHGDFNTPDTTPSGNVWGMPFAMLCGVGDTDLVGACDGPTADPHDAALIGGQVLDEQESRMLARSGVAQFGPGMLATPAGMAALSAWTATIGGAVDGLYIAIDLDVLDVAGGWALQTPEPDGLSLDIAIRAVEILAAGPAPVLGVGVTGVNLAQGLGAATIDAIARLVGAALHS